MTNMTYTVQNDSAVVREKALDNCIINAFQKLTPNNRMYILEEALRMLKGKK